MEIQIVHHNADKDMLIVSQFLSINNDGNFLSLNFRTKLVFKLNWHSKSWILIKITLIKTLQENPWKIQKRCGSLSKKLCFG